MTTGMGFCGLCLVEVPTIELLLHITVYHAAFSEPLLTWPDGEVVVIDTSLEPVDFADAALPLASETDAGLRRLAALTDTARPTRWDRIVAWVKAHPRSR